MTVDPNTYKVFYERICEAFAKKYRDGKKPPGTKSIYSRKLWDEPFKSGEHRGQFISTIVFAGKSEKKYRDYFYRPDLDDVDVIWMFNGLVELSFKLPNDFPKDATDEDRAENLWEQFEKSIISEHTPIADKENNVKNENISPHIDEISVEAKEETISASNNNNDQKSSNDERPVTHKQFFEALDLIWNYYKWEREDLFPHENKLANMFIHYVRHREYNHYNAEFISKDKDRSIRDFKYTDWEIYELYGERVVCRSLQFSNLDDSEGAYFPGFKSYITLGRKEQLVTSGLVATQSPYERDYFEFDYIHNTAIISNSNFERSDDSLKSHFIENYHFHYIRENNNEDIHAGHKCNMDDNNILTFIPAFLVAKQNSTSKQAPYHLEYNINSTDIPTNIRVRLLGWKILNLIPFKHIHLTTSLTLGGENIGLRFDELGMPFWQSH